MAAGGQGEPTPSGSCKPTSRAFKQACVRKVLELLSQNGEWRAGMAAQGDALQGLPDGVEECEWHKRDSADALSVLIAFLLLGTGRRSA